MGARRRLIGIDQLLLGISMPRLPPYTEKLPTSRRNAQACGELNECTVIAAPITGDKRFSSSNPKKRRPTVLETPPNA
jgi:hypothetical protein